MPTTYNGVGTHYYGKKHRQDRTAVCQSCGRVATLSSFETRLWFVFLFIPVIPLGRKRITDQCAVCSRHYVLPVKQWETARQTQTQYAMDQFRQSPSEESALIVHGTLLAFQQHEEANEFRRQMLERFPNNALLPAGLAQHLENNGLPEEALSLWNRAHELDSELPEARIGLARHRMFEDRLDEARTLLRFLEEPGAEQRYNMEPLFQLSSVMQQKQRHADTLEIVQVLVKAFPDVTSDRQFRKFVSKSEKAVQRQESVLPEVSHSLGKLFTSQYSSAQRWGLGVAVAAVLAAAGLAINNEYIRRHRPLTILNATGGAVHVQVGSQPPVTVSDKHVIPVPEGTHAVSITGAVTEQHSINVSSDYFSRWTSNPVWIINVGGEAVILDLSVHYAVQPRDPDVRVVADPVFVRDHVDYPFEEAPDSLEVGSESSVLSKTVLSWFNPETSPGGSLAGYLTLQNYSPQQAWEFAKRKLRRHPEDEPLIAYIADDVQSDQRAELQLLLEDNLMRRPVLIHWHRLYQDLPEVSRDYERLLARYDAMLAEEPKNAALLYLRGRIDADDEQQRQFNQLAREADPSLPWPDFSASYQAMSAGQWEDALKLMQSAVEKGLPANQNAGRQHFLMIALGRFKEAETLHRASLHENPANLSAAILLAESLIRQNLANEADVALENAVTSFTAETDGRFAERARAAIALRHYFKGDLTAAIQECTGSSDQGLSLLRIMMLIEQGEMDAAIQSLPTFQNSAEELLPVLCSLGFFAKGDLPMAEEWYQKSVQQLESSGPRYQAFTRFLKSGPTPETITEMQTLIADPPQKAALLTLLGTRTNSPELRASFFAAARQMMIQIVPPRGLLEKVHAMESRPQ